MGTVVLDKPSILRMSQCLVNGPCQSSLNKAITSSPWSEVAVNDRRHESIAPYHQTGFTVGIVDSTFIHHPRGHPIYGVYKYFDVEDRYTFAIQLVTRASRRRSFSSLDRQWTPFVSSLISVVIKRVIHRICKFTIGKRLDETLHGVFNGMFGAEAEFARLVDRK